MNWQQIREQYRGRLISKYDAVEATNYDSYVGTLAPQDEDAYLADLKTAIVFKPGQAVLDVGAGTGALTKLLMRNEGLAVTALEPSPAMCERLRAKLQPANVTIVTGGCDGVGDRDIFPEATFDFIVSRQVINSLFDPLMAFQHWRRWLKPGGQVVIIEGIYGRDGWSGKWQEEVDVLPLSACQSLATIPYLLHFIGLRVQSSSWMTQTNRLAATRTKRYMVVASRD